MVKIIVRLAIFFVITGSLGGASMVYGESVAQYWTFQKGTNLESDGRVKDAVAVFEKLLADDPGNPIIQRRMADAYYSNGQYSNARTIYEGLLKRVPKSQLPDIWYNLGNIAFKTNHGDAAVNWYRKCLLVRPNDQQSKTNLELAQNLSRSSDSPPPPSPPPLPADPSPTLSSLDQRERESRQQRRHTSPPKQNRVEKDW